MDWNWPDGKSFAFFLSFDFELNAHALRIRERDHVALTRGYTGLRAVPRLLDLMDRCGVKTTFFTCTRLLETHPELVAEVVKRGHEIGCHGYLHDDLTLLSADEERALFEKSDVLCKNVLKQPFAGFRAPYWKMNEGTPALIAEFGFTYDSDMMDSDEPYMLTDGTDDRPGVVELPVSAYMDDYPQYEAHHRAPSAFKAMVIEEIDAAKATGGYMSLSMHPFMELQASRLQALEGMLMYVQEQNGYVATGSELADAVRANLG